MMATMAIRIHSSRSSPLRTRLFASQLIVAASLVSSTHADAPGQFVHSAAAAPAGVTRHLTHALERFKRIERYAVSSWAPSAVPMALIREDGTLGLLTAENQPLGQVPSDLGTVLRAAATATVASAIRADGTLVRWPAGPAQPTLPAGSWIDVQASESYTVGLTADGSLHVWDDDEAFPNTGVASGARSISLGRLFGATLDDGGSVVSFGWAGQSAPSLPRLKGIRAIRFPLAEASTDGIERAAAIRSDGSLIGLAVPFLATTQSGYEDLHISITSGSVTGRIAALRGDGVVDEFAQAAVGWSAVPSQWYGRYDSIYLSNVGEKFGVWAYDANRDGANDEEQIAKGDLEDCNGDLVPDQVQLGNAILDWDANGVLDACESATIVPIRKGNSLHWGGSYPGTTVLVARASVPQHGSVVRHLSSTVSRIFAGTPPLPLALQYSIWSDPNQDGDPADAVRLGTWPLTSGEGLVELELEPTYIGPPGTLFFHGYTYEAPFLTGYQRYYPLPAAETYQFDRLSASGQRAMTWGAVGYEFGADPTAVLRHEAVPLEIYSPNSTLPLLALSWGERLPKDCDNSGTFDSRELAYTGSFDRDADNDGILDGCESDCNGNGTADVTEILAGAVDCDRNMAPDTCQSYQSFSQTIPVPAPSQPTVLSFQGVAPIASSSISISVTPRGDFSSATEFVTLQLGQQTAHVMQDADTTDCTAPTTIYGESFPASEWNASIVGSAISMTVRSSSFVDPAQCPDGNIRISFVFPVFQGDCNGNSVGDRCESFSDADCDGNRIVDSCEILAGAPDVDGNGVLDRCQVDCDRNGLPDAYEFAQGIAGDCDGNGLIDLCEGGDCDGDGIPNVCEVSGGAPDCNGDGVPDACQASLDCNQDGIIDECAAEWDCDGDGYSDHCQIAYGADDKDADGRLDSCEYDLGDFDLDDSVGAGDLSFLLSVWGSDSAIADLTGDGTVGGADLAILLSRWGPLYP
jgi:hypothetical protein